MKVTDLQNWSRVQAMISCKCKTAEKSAGKAVLLNKYFSSVFRPAADVNIVQICISDQQLVNLEVSVDEVCDHLKNLDTSKARNNLINTIEWQSDDWKIQCLQFDEFIYLHIYTPKKKYI